MSDELIGRGEVRHGVLVLDHGAWFFERIGQFEGDRVILAVRRDSRRRASNAFRNYYYAVVLPALVHYLIAEGCGDADEAYAHDLLAHKFLALGPCPVTGAPRRRSTAVGAMSDADFRRYVSDQVLPFLIGDLHLDIPEPDPEKRSRKRVLELRRRDELASGGRAHRS